MPDIFNIVSIGGAITSNTTASIVKLLSPVGGYPCLHNTKIALEQGQFVLPSLKRDIRSGIRNGAYIAAITICQSNLKNKIQGPDPKKVYYIRPPNPPSRGGVLVDGSIEITSSQQFLVSGGSFSNGRASLSYVGYIDSSIDGPFTNGQCIDEYIEYTDTFTPMFDGTFFLEHNSPSGLPTGSAARSMFAWVRVKEYTTPQAMFGYGGAEDNGILEFLYDNGKAAFYDNSSNGGPVDFSPNTWYLVGFASDGSSGKFFVYDTSSHAYVFYPTFNTSLGKVRVALGIGPEGLTSQEDLFIGDVVSMGIWNRFLSDGEINEMYNAGRTTYADLPSSLKTTFTTNVTNAQARSLNLANLQARSVTIGNLQSKSSGGFYQSARFNGSNRVVITNAPTNVNTISVWAKYDAVNSNGPIIVKGSNAWNSGLWDWGIWADNNNFYAVSKPGGSFCTLSHDNTSWYHIVLVRDNGSGSANIYLNGNLAASTESGNTNSLANTMYIGGVDVEYMHGSIEEIQLFDYALIPSEIVNMYNAGKGVYGNVHNIGLLAGYHFNNDLIDYKSENNGVWGGTPAFAVGGISTLPRQSASFTGSNRIAISQSTNIVAVSLWVNFSNSSGFGPIIVKGDDTWASTSWDWGIFADSNSFYAVAEPAGGPFCVISHDNNVWYHLVLVRDDGSGACAMYVNGILSTSGSASSSNVFGGNVFIGGVSGANMIGQVQEVQFFNTAPDSTMITNLYNYGVGTYGTSIPALIGGYHLNGNLNDYSAGASNGTWTGTAAYTTGITDKIYKAAKFDGGSRIAISSAPTNVNSVSIWVRSTEGGSGGAVITKGNDIWDSSQWDWSIWHDGGSTFYAAGPLGPIASYSYSFGSWYHLVLVQNDGLGASHFYVNGTLIASGSSATANNYADNIYIGGTDHYFNGQIQEVQLFSRGLSSEDVAFLYNNGSGVYGSSTDGGLVGGYHLDGKAIDYVSLNDAVWSGTEDYAAGFMGSLLTINNITTSASFNLESLTQVSLDNITTSSSSILQIVSPTIDYIRTSTGQILQFGTKESVDAGLLSFWNLTEGSGTRYDSVGSNHLNELSESASFTYATDVGRGNSTTFTDTSILAASWHWDFGDGNSSTSQSPTHTYNTNGIFFVTLTINGGPVFDSREVVVHEPVASFTTNSPQNLGDAISFTDTSTYAVSWLWDFGDETTSTSQNPTHTYDSGGTYTVSLQLNGDITNTSASVVVNILTSYIWDKLNISPYYNKIGFVDNGFDYTGLPNYGLDGIDFVHGSIWATGGNIMSANYLGNSPKTFGGIEFDTPISDNTTPNIIYCEEQVIPLNGGQYTNLFMLGFVTNVAFMSSVPFVITYSDSTTDTINLGMSDWMAGAHGFGDETLVITTTSRLTINGIADGHQAYIYKYQLSLDPTKNAVSITMPSTKFVFIVSITQASLISKPACWLKADTLALSDGDAIATWTDRSGNSNDLTQSTEILKPLYKTNILNGHPAILFDGNNDYIQSTISVPNKYSVIAVYKQTVPGSFSIAVSWGSGISGKTFWSGYIPDSSGQPYPGHLIPASDSATDTYTSSVDDTNWHLITGKFDGTHITGSDFNTASTPSLDQLSGTLSSSKVTIGGYGDAGGLNWAGYIAEVFFFNSELSDTDRDLIKSYLKYKYNLVSQNEVQQVSFDAEPTSGTFTITINGQTTGGIPYNANAADVQNYINASIFNDDANTHVS